jgi:Ni,Fe-hydrogenase I cytochrome b subunit
MDINPPSSVGLNKISLPPGSSESDATLFIRDDEVFIRMTRSERLQHIVLIICFVLLVLTGLPLLLDPVAWLKKAFFFETSFAWRGRIHRVAGVVLIALSVFHLAYIVFTERGREVFWALMPKLKDVTDALESFGHNLGFTGWLYGRGVLRQFFDRHPYWLFQEPPRYGRFNFIEKFEYLAVWWGNAVMIVSGFFLRATKAQRSQRNRMQMNVDETQIRKGWVPSYGALSKGCALRHEVLASQCSNNVATRDDANQPVLFVNYRKTLVARFHHHFQDTR